MSGFQISKSPWAHHVWQKHLSEKMTEAQLKIGILHVSFCLLLSICKSRNLWQTFNSEWALSDSSNSDKNSMIVWLNSCRRKSLLHEERTREWCLKKCNSFSNVGNRRVYSGKTMPGIYILVSPVNFFLKVCGDNFTLVNIGNTLENSERNVLYTDLILFNYTKAILESSLRPDMTLPFP